MAYMVQESIYMYTKDASVLRQQMESYAEYMDKLIEESEDGGALRKLRAKFRKLQGIHKIVTSAEDSSQQEEWAAKSPLQEKQRDLLRQVEEMAEQVTV